MKHTIKNFLLTAALSLSFLQVNAANASWITASKGAVNDTNTWIAFQKYIPMRSVPRSLKVRIACDSKYWLWVNGKMTVFEGQLKRGPVPGESYYDAVDLAPWLRRGNNVVSVLVCYFGKSGFSHESSGKAGLIIESPDDRFDTNTTWLATIDPAYGIASGDYPNYRLSESNLRFDARKQMQGWQTKDCRGRFSFAPAQAIGSWGDKPWGTLHERPIPLLKDYGIKQVSYQRHAGDKADTYVAQLPANIQFTPVIDITALESGQVIDLRSDHEKVGGEKCVRAEYVTKKGRQTYESLGWISGNKLIVTVPKGVTVNSLAYRQTGYDTYPQGRFTCDNNFINRFWRKALNTLYVNMRDTYMDCPDRERAQWWGDETLLGSEAFYALSRSADALMRKGMLELCAWQKPTGILYAPVPGSYRDELPAQMLAAVSLYGFWNYYMNTGDLQTIRKVYPSVLRYLATFLTDSTGLTAVHSGGWNWGDHGGSRDLRLIYAAWHYMALEGAARMADVQGLTAQADSLRGVCRLVKQGYNRCWNGACYRHPEFMEATDDRVQALAVVSGIAGPDKYDAIEKVLRTQSYASPYMEKYVLQALFHMGHGEDALRRMEQKYGEMVNDTVTTTLWESWNKGGGWSVNHAWSGGPLIVIVEQLMGLTPLEPGYAKFRLNPCYVGLGSASLEVPTIRGTIKTGFSKGGGVLRMSLTVPSKTEALVYIPSANPASVTINGKPLKAKQTAAAAPAVSGKTPVWLKAGSWQIEVK